MDEKEIRTEFNMKLNSVIQGDCLELMKDIPDKSIDLILCDLPYGMTACKWDIIIPFEPLWKEYERIIKDNGAIVLTASQPFTSLLICSNLEMFRYEWVWDKVNKSTGWMDCYKRPLKKHENILIFSKSQTTYNPIFAEGESYSNRRTQRKNYEGYGNNSPKFTQTEDNRTFSHGVGEAGKRFPNSILPIKSHKPTGIVHPTQKPVALFEYLIKTYTNEGDLVLDNCAGSGTTAIAAINTKRNYICMELDETYFKLINKRIKKHTSEKPLI